MGWKDVDAHLKAYAPGIKLPKGYVTHIDTLPEMYDKIAYMTQTVDQDPEIFHGLLRVVAGLAWPAQGVPALEDKTTRVIKCGATHFKRIESLATTLYTLLDHIKTRDLGLWQSALRGWNGIVSLNSTVPGVQIKRDNTYGYVNSKNERIAGCIFVSPITTFAAKNKPRNADLTTTLHELAHLSCFAERKALNTPRLPGLDPHDDPIWLAHFNAYMYYATTELGWTLAATADPTTSTGLRYNLRCSLCQKV